MLRTALGAGVSCPRAQDTGSLQFFRHRLDIWIEVGPPPVRLAPLLNPYHYHGNTEKPDYASRAKVAPGFVASYLSSRGGATLRGR